MVGGLPNKSIWNIDYDDLVFGDVIGKGNFGLVFRGNYLGVEVAIKQIPSYDDPDYCKYTEREVKALRYIRHPYIVHFFGACHHTSGFYLITEYIEDQDLRRFIKSSVEYGRPPKWSTRVSIALSIAKTFLFLHSKNILHRDLKSKNVLLEITSKNITTKLCDFGFTRIGSQYTSGEDSSSSEDEDDNDSEIYNNNGNGKPAKYKLRKMSICGTISFMAPEVLLQQKYDWSVDVYSFGIILAELITLKRPGKDFWVRNQLNNFDISFQELKLHSPPDLPMEFLDLCMKCCSFQSNQRPKFSEIIQILENIQLRFNSSNNSLLSKTTSSNFELSHSLSNNSNSSFNNTNTSYSIGIFKEKKRQSINEIFKNQFSLRTSFNSNNNQNSNNEREGIIKLNNNYSNNIFNSGNIENIWLIYKQDDRIEMTLAKIVKLSKGSVHILINDVNLQNGHLILSIKPYLKEFPHIIYNNDNQLTNSNNNNNQQNNINNNNNSSKELFGTLIKSWLIRKRYNEFKSNWKDDQRDSQHQWVSLTNQLIQSEMEYKKQLDLIIKSYLDPLKSKFRMNKPLIGIKEINCIFSNIELMSELNSEFLKVIQYVSQEPFYYNAHSDQDSKVTTISQFIQNVCQPQIKSIYGAYAFNFKYATNILAWCKLNPDFSAFLDRVKSQFKGYEEYDLISLLSLPINKIQKYLFYFEKLVQVTPVQHYDQRNLSNAFSLIKETSNSIQTQLEMSLEYSQLMSIETMLLNNKSPLIRDGRWFIRQGLLEDLSKKQQYQLFLLSDVLILTRPQKSKSSNDALNKKFYYSIRNQIQLDESVSMKPNPDQTNGIILSLGNGNKTYKLIPTACQNIQEESSDWLNDFERTIILLYRNSVSDHSKSLEDIYNGANGGSSSSNITPLSLSNSNIDTPSKGIIRRFRQSISGGSGNSPDRRASLLNLNSKDSNNNNNNNNHQHLKSTLSVANLQLNNTNSNNSFTPNTPNMNSTNNDHKKGKFNSITKKLKRLSVTFSSSPISDQKNNKKEISRD
ncbi:putative glycophosphotransferase [Tieghemostelium lacteum]|uniref:non-specific serine/threonine protein kinase n=1 Tax=Tieghemostelium lacteum TaxID=361077 RepID=A0A151ZC38_TIELA|nr:putative glycophosphotransferase [Tieghemostelium lacteum]|eukprot:KYQ91508.1 putative glycophosphotransferase [Tieghemostelium lacteum]